MNANLTLEQRSFVESERIRISRDIHDNFGARLTEVMLLSDLARRKPGMSDEIASEIGRISLIAREMIRDLDRIIWAINPKNDFMDCLASYIARFSERFLGLASIRCRLELDELPHFPLASEVRHDLLLVIKEALNNIVKHSAASEVWVRVKFEKPAVTIDIEDNGKGFERPGECRNGLYNMESRMRELGGEFALRSRVGKGTKVTIRIFDAETANSDN